MNLESDQVTYRILTFNKIAIVFENEFDFSITLSTQSDVLTDTFWKSGFAESSQIFDDVFRL